MGEWNKSQLRDPEIVEQVFKDFRETVKLLKKEMIPATFRSILAYQPERPPLRREWMPELINQSNQKLRHAVKDQSTWSAAELLRAAAYFLHTGREQVKVKYMDGPHEEPVGISAPVEFTAEQVCQTAWTVTEAEYVPSVIDVGGIPIGPCDYLVAAGQVLAGAKTVRLNPISQLPDVAGVYRFDKLNLSGWMYPEGWMGRKAASQLHGMMWTFRPEYPVDM